MKVEGKILDIHNRRIFNGIIEYKKGKISRILETDKEYDNYILPGLIDSHIHIESSMVTPGAFAKAAVSRGTIGTVSDPHEIANVLGVSGVDFMISDSYKVPVKFFFGAPSCVPATEFETSGSRISDKEIEMLLQRKEIKFLAEMMNFPGVIYGNKEVISKIEIAREKGKNIDGHAPGLTGKDLEKYINSGITTDHECSSIEEAKEKIGLGMKILIREGSAARNLEALKSLFKTDPDKVMLCSDDLHPETLRKRHLDKIVAKLICEGYDIYDVIRSCTLNPVSHYGLEAGLLRVNDPADFIIVDDLKKMNVLETWIDGDRVYNRGEVSFNYDGAERINRFNCSTINKAQIDIKTEGKQVRVIKAYDGELFTSEQLTTAKKEGIINPDEDSDILKIVVKDRYNDGAPAIGFISGFGLKSGAMASSVAHDSHNIICIGANDEDIVNAVNKIVEMKGGLAISASGKISSLPLPIGGIMSDKPVDEIADLYENISARTKELGCPLSAPFMTMSFMALLVIPELKISDKGLFDGRQFRHVSLFV